MEDKLATKITSIESKVKQLVDSKECLEANLKEVTKENDILRRTIQSYEWQISEMNEQAKVMKIASSMSSDKDNNKAVKLKINELVREIDKCIALITK